MRTPELSIGLLDRLVREFRSKGVSMTVHRHRQGQGERIMAVLKGPGGWQGGRLALTLLSPYAPHAVIERGGALSNGDFEVLVWLNAPPSVVASRSSRPT